MNKIIAVGHHKNVGKDEFVKFCIDIVRPQISKLRITRRGFADKLYEVCESLYGWAGFKDRAYYQEVPSRKNEKLLTGWTVREILIELGNKMREFDENIWINATLKNKDANVLFVSDLRYPNEFKAIKDEGGICIKIVRPGLPEPTDVADTALNNHHGWDLILNNDGDLNRLHRLAETFCQEFLLP